MKFMNTVFLLLTAICLMFFMFFAFDGNKGMTLYFGFMSVMMNLGQEVTRREMRNK